MSGQRFHRFTTGILSLAAGAGCDLLRFLTGLDYVATKAMPSPKVLQ